MGQTGTVCFELIDSTTQSPVSEIKVSIIDSIGTEILSMITSDSLKSCLSGIPFGQYIIELKHESYQTICLTGVIINESEYTFSNIFTLPPKPIDCNANTAIVNCPYCKSKKKVLPIKPGMVVNYTFRTEADIRRYDRKRDRQKYELYNDNGQVVVIVVWLPNEHEKFWDFQHCWFCRKCKKVF
jgi:hypothetical protein